MGTLNVTTDQLARLVDQLLFRERHGLDLRSLGAISLDLFGVAAATNVITGYLATGGVPPIGPPKPKKLARLVAVGNPGASDSIDKKASGGVKPIGPPKFLDDYIAGLIKGRSPVPRMYPDLSAWVELRIPKELRSTCLCVAAAQFQEAIPRGGKEFGPKFSAAADLLFAAAFRS
jgi:hypothetical protein